MTPESTYIISTPRLGLRRWLPADVEPFARMNQDPVVREFFPNLMTFDESRASVRVIERHFDEYGYGLYVVDLLSTGEFIGFTGFSHPSFDAWFVPCVEIGWRLLPEAWGQGYATEAARECLRHGFGVLGLTKVLSFTAVLNTRSERVMQKIGMTRVGEFGHPGVAQGHVLRPHVLYEMKLSQVNRAGKFPEFLEDVVSRRW
jgi:RimJ/RimL family protein N-acetyltransferase